METLTNMNQNKLTSKSVFLLKIDCELILRNISTNELFNPAFLKVELLFTNIPVTLRDHEL